MSNVEFGDIATWISALVAVGAMLLSLWASRDANKHQQEAAELTRRNADLLEKRHQLELRSWTDLYFSSVRSWADEVCCAISEAIHIVEYPRSTNERKFEVLVRLSALIDTGRWYFPNQWADSVGTKKHPAYRGVRQPVLDCVFAAYHLLKFENEANRVEGLVSTQREFVSHIQNVLDPKARDQEIRKVLEEFEVSQTVRKE